MDRTDREEPRGWNTKTIPDLSSQDKVGCLFVLLIRSRTNLRQAKSEHFTVPTHHLPTGMCHVFLIPLTQSTEKLIKGKCMTVVCSLLFFSELIDDEGHDPIVDLA